MFFSFFSSSYVTRNNENLLSGHRKYQISFSLLINVYLLVGKSEMGGLFVPLSDKITRDSQSCWLKNALLKSREFILSSSRVKFCQTSDELLNNHFITVQVIINCQFYSKLIFLG